MAIAGIDVSDYQGQVDWPAVAVSGRRFAFAKASEGAGFSCRTFARNWQAIKAAGLVRGAYHFARPDVNAPEAEADFFLKTVGPLETGDLLALDLEAGSGDLRKWGLGWMTYVQERAGFKPLLYSGHWFLAPHGCEGSSELARYGLWLAAYQTYPPPVPPSWPFAAFWQHTSSASVPGVDGGCDESIF